MKKIFYVLLIIILGGIIFWETPIVIKSMQKDDAIELLNKGLEYQNFEVTKTYSADGILYKENKKHKADYATVLTIYHDNEEVGREWYDNKYIMQQYSFDGTSKTCSPSYSVERQDYIEIMPNEEIIDILYSTKNKNLKFTNVEFEGVEALEIRHGEKDNQEVIVVEKETGFVLTKYAVNGGVDEIYKYEINKLTDENLAIDFEGYTIKVDTDKDAWERAIVMNVMSDDHLPQDFIHDFAEAKKDIVNAFEIKPTDENE